MTLFFLTLGVMLIALCLLGIRMILIPGSDFRGSCSANNPFKELHGEDGCPTCGREPEDPCPNEQLWQRLSLILNSADETASDDHPARTPPEKNDPETT